MLTVVVPVYRVEQYLPACLESVAAQPLYRTGGVRVVVVDDGSPDRSGVIADAFAAAQPPGWVRVIHQCNAGLGAARNAAIPHVDTPYLTFLDSDDVLPADAWTRMLQVIEQTGSDMAVGKLVRVNGGRISTGHWMDVNHRQQLLGVGVPDRPEILADVFAVNKVYRSSFWHAAGLAFPVGTRYEDQPTLTRAMLVARSIDMLPDVVYCWRVREDGTSLTQARRQLADIRDRITTKLESLDMVREYSLLRGRPGVLRTFLTRVLPVDMWEYFRGSVGNNDAYWSALRECVQTVWHDVPFHHAVVPVQQRLMGWLVSEDRRADLERLLFWLDETPARERVRDGLLLHPFLGEPGLPAEVTLAGHQDVLPAPAFAV